MSVMNCPIIIPRCCGPSINAGHSSRGFFQARSNLVPQTEQPLAVNSMSGGFPEQIYRFSLIQREFSSHALIQLSPESKLKLRKEGNQFSLKLLILTLLKSCHKQTLFSLTYCTSKQQVNQWFEPIFLNHHSQLTESSVHGHLQYTGQIRILLSLTTKAAVLLKDWISFPTGSQQTWDRIRGSLTTMQGSGHLPSTK